MEQTMSAYGLWGLVIVNSLVFIIFAFSFFKPNSPRDWRTFGTFAAFIVALFVEMYGVPLTLYLLAGWLQSRYPQLDPLSHDAGHLWNSLLGLEGNPHFGVLHILSNLLIFGGFWLLASAWRVLYRAQGLASASNFSANVQRWVEAMKARLDACAPALDVAGADVLASACRLGLEGVIAKRRDAPYRSRRDSPGASTAPSRCGSGASVKRCT